MVGLTRRRSSSQSLHLTIASGMNLQPRMVLSSKANVLSSPKLCAQRWKLNSTAHTVALMDVYKGLAIACIELEWMQTSGLSSHTVHVKYAVSSVTSNKKKPSYHTTSQTDHGKRSLLTCTPYKAKTISFLSTISPTSGRSIGYEILKQVFTNWKLIILLQWHPW